MRDLVSCVEGGDCFSEGAERSYLDAGEDPGLLVGLHTQLWADEYSASN